MMRSAWLVRWRQHRLLFWLSLLLIVALLTLLAMALWAPETIRLLRRDNTWRTMQAKGIWRVGMDPSFPPFESLDAAGKPVGFDVALAAAIAEGWKLQVELVPIGFDSLLDALQTGQVDSIISALPYDERLTKDVAYSAPYFEAGIFLATLPTTGIQATTDLAQQTVGVEWGSMGDMVGRRLQSTTPTLHLQPFDTPAEAIAALVEQRTVAAILVDHVTLRMAQVNGAPLHAVGPVLESNPFVIAMPIAAYELQSAVAQRLATLQQMGKLTELEAIHFQHAP
ncbi:MAG: amino acid ABC transporter substrate-binding protein [Caldilineaceae bacterium]|nr:amino acid ABC transporter substrate-binding protein [Caldilineaceae bacterium]